MVDDIESAILKRLENPLAFEPYRSAKRREYPYYRIYVRKQLKEFVNFVPGEITEVTDRSYGTLSHSERYDKSPDGYYGVTTYRLSYNAIDDQNFEYVITMEYIKENKANPGEVGLNYVNIYKFDSDGKRIGFMEIGNTLV